MNVSFVTNIDELGGGELWVLNACRHLQAQGHHVSVVCPYRSGLYDEAVRRGLDLFAFELKEGSPFYNPLFHFLQKRSVDVLYCTLIGRFWEAKVLEQLADRINQHRSRGRMIVILKTGLPPMSLGTPEFYGVGVGPAIRRLHVVCETTRKAFLRWEPRMPAEFVEAFYEGVDLSRFDPVQYDRGTSRERWEVAADRKVITCLARLNADKGQDNLLLAAHEIRKTHPEAQFIFAGEGDQRSRLEQLANHLQLDGSARFLGRVDDVPSLLAATDIVCHPSLNDSLPNALVEAMAMGKAVVASDLEGIPELVDHGTSGLLVRPHDIHALIEGLRSLLEQPDAVERIGACARSKVEERFNLAGNVRGLVTRLQEEQRHFDRSPEESVTRPLPRTDPIRVLFLLNVLRTGGEETEVAILARYLDRKRFQPIVLSCWAVDEPSPARERLERLGVPVDTACHGMPAIEDKVRYIIDKIRREYVGVVVACQDTALAYYVFQNLGRDECRLIEHGGILNEVRRIPKTFTARYVGVSTSIAALARDLMEEPSGALAIPSMVDGGEYGHHDRATLRKAYGLPDDACVITFTGRLDPKKRIEDLIAAAEALLPKYDNVRFLVVGPLDAFVPDYGRRLMENAATVTATGRFLFTGGRSDIPQILSASDIFVLPAVDEGMSHAINEAGAAGLAVVAADTGAARAQLEDGRAGRIVEPASRDQLTATLVELIEQPVLRQSLGERLMAKVRNDYSHEAVIPQWERLLTAVAREIPRSHPPFLPMIRHDELLPFPREIQIQTNTLCNAACIMCPYPEVSTEFPRGTMQQELYDDILDQCSREPGLWRIEPFLMNEPFTDRRLTDWIALAKQRVPHAIVTVTTNGTLVRPNVTDRLIHSGLDAIWFSFNGATKETFEKIMGCSFDTVAKNMDYLLSVRPATLQVFTNMIETIPMEPEIEENIRRWYSRGVGSGSSKLVNRGGNVRNFAELNYRPLHSQPVRLCDLLFHKMYVLHNGDVVLCCMDWRRQVVMGNLGQQSLREIWHGEKYQHYRQLHEEGRSKELDLCATCSYVYN